MEEVDFHKRHYCSSEDCHEGESEHNDNSSPLSSSNIDGNDDDNGEDESDCCEYNDDNNDDGDDAFVTVLDKDDCSKRQKLSEHTFILSSPSRPISKGLTISVKKKSVKKKSRMNGHWHQNRI
jgi:hypothetical protein